MTDFQILNGGSPRKEGLTEEVAIERLKVFVQHMRAIENSISMVKRMAENMKWNELSKRASDNHKGLLDTLHYVKTHQKQIVANMATKSSGEHLTLISNESDQDSDHT